MFLQHFPPMGVYETLFRFADATGKYMGDPGTHPWAQGFPLTTQLATGPELPGSVSFESTDLKYPTAAGQQPLREAIADYYNHFYQANISADHVAVFAGGRPAIYAILAFALDQTTVVVEETEYPPYYDALQLLRRNYRVVKSNAENKFRPGLDDYSIEPMGDDRRVMLLTSNPCNPTGVAKTESELKELVQRYSHPDRGAIFDEAYEFFSESGPLSALKLISDIDQSNLFVVGAATKGLQVPGMRIGWLVAAKHHVEIFRNFSSIAMGGVARPSQIYVARLLELTRAAHARDAVAQHYNSQRDRYRRGLENLGIELFTGNGGFYHWGRLPGELTADELNLRLFQHQAAVLPGQVCDMLHRRGPECPLSRFIRFSFGPIPVQSYDDDMRIMEACLKV